MTNAAAKRKVSSMKNTAKKITRRSSSMVRNECGWVGWVGAEAVWGKGEGRRELKKGSS